MRQVLFLSAAAAALALAAPPAIAEPIIVFPPAGSHSFVQLSEIDSGLRSCPHIQCQIVGDPSVSSSMAPVTFSGSDPRDFITAFGSTGPTTMHAFLRASDAGEIDTAFTDTYTVHGGVAPFMITVTMNIDSIASTIPFGPGNIGILAVSGIIGQFDLDPNRQIPGVDAFGPTSSGNASKNFSGGLAGSAPLNLTVSYSRLVNPGDVFDLAYELTADGVGQIDASNTAAIGFTLPDGVFLTAASGATFGDLPGVGGVPEPASWALMIAGFGLAGAMLRRRRALLA